MRGIGIRKRLALDAHAIQRRIAAELHELTYLFWECTLRCTLSCVHCGSDCTADPGVPDMPLEDFLRVLDGIASSVDPAGVMVCLTGGEPALRSDLERCGREILARGFPWGFVTSGTGLGASRLRRMVSEGLGSVTVSLDGLRGSHDWFRGSAGSFDRACDVIGRAAGYGSLVMDVVTCVNRRNLDELDDIRGLLRDMGVARWRIFTVFPRGRATEVPELFLDGSQFGQVLDFIAACRREPGMDVAYGCEGFLGRWEGEARNGFFDCRAGVSIGSVLADGSISACPSLRGDFIQGNIYTDEFMAVWNGRFGVMRRRDWMKSGGCASCRLWKWCTGGAMHLRDEKTGETLLCHPKWLGELR